MNYSSSIKPHLSIADCLKYTSIALYVLAAICFMVYTTEQNYTFAEGSDSTDLGYDITSANASVTVGAACTLSGTETSSHASTISNGLSSSGIGTTVLNTTCNDSGGYALYAIGYTDDTYGNTSLTYTAPDGITVNSNYDIPTGTATSGSASSWAVKLDTVPGSTLATIENGYRNYNVVPEDYTKVATLNTITDPGTHTSGSSVYTTYQAYISPTQPAGTYTGKVKYTMVHPSTAPKPEVPLYMQNTALIKRRLTNVGDTAQAIDSRDGKSYWVAKLADGNVWMTQNLDLDIDSTKTYTSADTDLPEGTTWTPTTSTYTDSTWAYSKYTPESYNPGNRYWDGILKNNESGNIANNTTNSGDPHYHIGNYYNWTAAVAMNNSGSYGYFEDVNQSICPAGWSMMGGDYLYLTQSGIAAGENGNIHISPNHFVYGGYWGGESGGVGYRGNYWTSHVGNYSRAYYFSFNSLGDIIPENDIGRGSGMSIRCVAR